MEERNRLNGLTPQANILILKENNACHFPYIKGYVTHHIWMPTMKTRCQGYVVIICKRDIGGQMPTSKAAINLLDYYVMHRESLWYHAFGLDEVGTFGHQCLTW